MCHRNEFNLGFTLKEEINIKTTWHMIDGVFIWLEHMKCGPNVMMLTNYVFSD